MQQVLDQTTIGQAGLDLPFYRILNTDISSPHSFRGLNKVVANPSNKLASYDMREKKNLWDIFLEVLSCMMIA